MTKKIVILGASGFVGRNLREYFGGRYDIFAPSHAELDVLDELRVTDYLKEQSFDVVINALDRRTDKPLPNARFLYAFDRLRMFEILAKAHNLYGKMLYFGTGAEYGKDRSVIRVSEDDFGRVVPDDPYGFAMYTMSNLAPLRGNIYNFRLFGIFGKYEHYKTRFISNAICKALLGYPITIRQNALFDYLYIDDLCRMTEYFVENDMKHKHYNATSGMSHSLLELAEAVRGIVNHVPVYIAKDGLKNEYTSNNSRIARETGFAAGDIKLHIKELAGFYEKRAGELDREALLYNNS